MYTAYKINDNVYAYPCSSLINFLNPRGVFSILANYTLSLSLSLSLSLFISKKANLTLML